MSRFAYRCGLIDIPNERSSHVLPTPRGGGVGILAVFLTTSIYLGMPLFTWLPASLLSVVSLFDDRLNLTSRTRLLVQFVASFAVIASAYYPPGHSWPALIAVSILLTLFLSGTANFYNFMDGINGIAGMTGTVAFALLAYYSSVTGQQYTLQLLALSAASLGFLPLNVPRAQVFMGDVGSILLGFTFASSTVFLSHSAADFMTLTGCLFPFYADTLSTLFVRWQAGEKLTQAHRRHLYQIIVNRMSIPHWKVSLGYAVLQLAIGFICVSLKDRPAYSACILAGCFTLWCFGMTVIRGRYESN